MIKIIIILIFLLFQTVYSQPLNWYQIQIRPPLTSMSFANNSTGYVFANSIKWKTEDEGNTWKLENNIPQFVGQSSQSSVHFIPGQFGIAVYGYDILRSTNNGLSWYNVFNSVCQTTSLQFINPSQGYAYGIAPSQETNLIKTNNSGLSWINLTKPPLGPQINSLFFVNPSLGFAAGTLQDTIAVTYDGGLSWVKKSTGAQLFLNFIQLYFIDEQEGWMLSDYYYIFKTTDGGNSWNYINTDIQLPANMFFNDPKTGWITGEGVNGNGLLVKTADSGSSWNLSHVFSDGPTSQVLFKDFQTGFVTGKSGQIYKTINSGNSWNQYFELPQSILTSIKFSDIQTAWLTSIEGTDPGIWKSTNSGYNWLKVYDAPNYVNINSLHSFNNDKIIGAGDYGSIVYTTDGGVNWNFNKISSTLFNCISFFDSNTGWVCGNGGSIFKSTNGGDHWAVQSTNTNGNYLSIHAISNLKCFAVGNDSLISMTTDGGITWSRQFGLENTDHKQVFFVNSNTGFILSSKFFQTGIGSYFTRTSIYKTTNEGNQWTRVFQESASSIHSIFNSICFSDSLNGVIVGDRGRIIRTLNGGLSWVEYFPQLPPPYYTNFYSVSYYGNIGLASGSPGLLFTTSNNVIGIDYHNSIIKDDFNLYQNYPNPFNPQTTIKFYVSRKSDIELKIFDLRGRVICTLIKDIMESGFHEVTFNADRYNLSSGIYFYSLISGNMVLNKKLLFIK
ncbi:MAG: YCF48-related protein [Bacteroidota bacterium]|nr:YCF48-related protein [Bacteroidota bacterium]